MKFKNTPNKKVKFTNGKHIWYSRSCAVVALVEAVLGKDQYLLLCRRGPDVSSEPGKLTLPGGYVDFNESGLEAAYREIYEETGLDVHDEKEWGHDLEPWSVNSDPSAYGQTISLRYHFKRFCKELPELSTVNCEPNEITEAMWVPIREALDTELAFGLRDTVVRRYYFNPDVKEDRMYLEECYSYEV